MLAVLPGSLRSRLLSWYMGEHRAMLDDFDAVHFTRYPPGLAAALDTMGEGSTVVAGAGRTSAHLWVVPPHQHGSAEVSPASDQPTINARSAALREL
jgi:hypothetical protein